LQKESSSFTDKVLLAFKKINSEINIDSLEHDFSPRLAKYLIEGVLGYDGADYTFERSRTDITLLDENKNRVVVIETKRPKENLDAETWRTQAGKYADSSTHFVGLTNGYRFILWEIIGGEKVLKSDIDFLNLINSKKTLESKISTKEVEQILFLNNITKEQIWSEAKYGIFDPYYAKIDVAEDAGFDKLIEQLNYISNDILRQYTYSAFDEYYANYAQYKQAKDELEEMKKYNGNNRKQAAEIARYELKTEGRYKKFSTFSGYYIWKALSNRPDDKEEENKQVFCKESIYVLINRLLFIRICEDRGLITKRIISNGGVEKLRDLLSEEAMPDAGVFKQIVFGFSYDRANTLYYHFYEKNNPLDWYQSGDGELDKILNKVLWLLNQFNFAKVDRDILGKLYEKYLPKEERKQLGEFYTPDEVIDYILDSVEYEPSKAIENKDLIDPACGSGGFLVRASRRLIARCAVKFGKATPKEALDNKRWKDVYDRLTPKECEDIVNTVALRIHGFDINPFAVNISEMNLLFQVIDLYFKAVKSNKTFVVPRFKVYGTDSLELPSEQASITQFYEGSGRGMAQDLMAVEEFKKKRYDFVVGNPPYVRVQKLGNIEKNRIKESYSSVEGKFDLYIPFLELGIKLIREGGKLGYINPNLFIQREYGKKIRALITKETQISQILDFGDSGVFADATNYPCIIILNKSPIEETKIVKVIAPSDTLLDQIRSCINEKTKRTEYFTITTKKPDEFSSDWFLGSKAEKAIFGKIKSRGKSLGELIEMIQEGLITGANEVYFVDGNKAKELSPELEFMKPVPKGKDVRRYSIKWNGGYVIYTQNNDGTPISDIMIRKNPKLYQYLEHNRSILEKRTYVIKAGKKWYEIWNPRNVESFEQTKIITPNLSRNNNFALDIDEFYLDHDCYGIILKDKKLSNYKYILGLLNSKALEFFLKQISPFASGKYYRYMTSYLEQLPIYEPKTDKEKRTVEDVIAKVDEILKLKKKDENADTKKLEEQIDELVFKLYGIDSAEEREVIERAIAD
jgi:type I restriction-modification system DNA methylase subunit